jgi:hypothetical protein
MQVVRRGDVLVGLKRQLALLQRRGLCPIDIADRVRKHAPDIADEIAQLANAGNDIYRIAQEGDGQVPLILVMPLAKHLARPSGFGNAKLRQLVKTPRVPYLMIGARDGMSRWRETIASARVPPHAERLMTVFEAYAYRQAYVLLPGQMAKAPPREFGAAGTVALLADGSELIPTLKDDGGHVRWIRRDELLRPDAAPTYPWCVERRPLPE